MSGREPIWKAVIGFEGIYEVSDVGDVRSLDRVIAYDLPCRSGEIKPIRSFRPGRTLRATPNEFGHLVVDLGRGHRGKKVHILVLEAFVGPRPEGCNGLHDNDNPSDNRVSNLNWGSQSKNILDAIRNGKKKIGEECSYAKLRSVDIPVIRQAITSGELLREIASRYGVSVGTIQNINHGKAWRHVS